MTAADGAGGQPEAALAARGVSGFFPVGSQVMARVQGEERRLRAVDGVSFDVAAGQALGLVGESGSGKSMTLRAVLGLLPPEARVTSGQVLLDGVDLLKVGQSQLNRIRGPNLERRLEELRGRALRRAPA